MLAAKEFVKTDTSGFPPAIGQLREIARKFKHDDLVDEKILQLQEPDDRVRAIKNHGELSKSNKNFKRRTNV